jgi:uncharacterized membrane protein
MRTAVVISLAVLAQAIGNTLVSKGMKAIAAGGSGVDILSPWLLFQAMGNPMIWGGTVFLILFFVLFTAALSWADLSFVLPASSFGYILNVAFASHFLDEPVSSIRWTGTVLIFLGVVLVSKSGSTRGSPS